MSDGRGMSYGREDERALESLYWFYRMVKSGGPDGTELDEKVDRDAGQAAEWYDAEMEAEGGRLPEFDNPKYAPEGGSK